MEDKKTKIKWKPFLGRDKTKFLVHFMEKKKDIEKNASIFYKKSIFSKGYRKKEGKK